MNVDGELEQLSRCIDSALQEADRLGATQAEVAASCGEGLSVSVRNADVETVEFTKNHGFAITVYKKSAKECVPGLAKGSASTSDLSKEAIHRAVAAALDIAHYTAEDKYAGLAPSELMCADPADLDLYHPWGVKSDEAISIALSCEQAGLAYHTCIEKSDGVSVNSSVGVRYYGNSHGFRSGGKGSRHSLGCGMIANGSDGMERSHWFSSSRLLYRT